MTTIDSLITAWTSRRDKLVKRLQELDGADPGSDITLGTELRVVRKVLTDLRRVVRHHAASDVRADAALASDARTSGP